MAAYRRVVNYDMHQRSYCWLTYGGHLRADCLYTGISSGPNARYRVWEAFTFFSAIIIITVWLVQRWTLSFLRAFTRLDDLCSTIGSCRTNVEWCCIRFNGQEPGVTRSAQSAVPVTWQRRHTGPKGSTVVNYAKLTLH